MTEVFVETGEDEDGAAVEAVGNLTLEEDETTPRFYALPDGDDNEGKPGKEDEDENIDKVEEETLEKEDEIDVTKIRYSNVWNKNDETVQKGVMDLWDDQFGDGMTADVKKKRLGAVCVVAYDGENNVIAVSTLIVNPNKSLWCKVGYFRCMVRSGDRLKGIATQLAVECKQVLAEYSKAHPGENIKAFAMMVNGKQFGAHGKKPFWPKTGSTIVGYNEIGMQVRIAWLEDARVEY